MWTRLLYMKSFHHNTITSIKLTCKLEYVKTFCGTRCNMKISNFHYIFPTIKNLHFQHTSIKKKRHFRKDSSNESLFNVRVKLWQIRQRRNLQSPGRNSSVFWTVSQASPGGIFSALLPGIYVPDGQRKTKPKKACISLLKRSVYHIPLNYVRLGKWRGFLNYFSTVL